jgi:hypothetical protein
MRLNELLEVGKYYIGYRGNVYGAYPTVEDAIAFVRDRKVTDPDYDEATVYQRLNNHVCEWSVSLSSRFPPQPALSTDYFLQSISTATFP